jgi:hypothetical protein
MPVFKRVLCKRRLRQVPPQFSWIDHRLVRDRHISRCSSDALALYLFLVTVADGQGLSYYADQTICRLLPALDGGSLSRARAELVASQLIAYQPPLYQVLALGPALSLSKGPALSLSKGPALSLSKGPDFGELPSGLTSASSVEPSLRVQDGRGASPSPQAPSPQARPSKQTQSISRPSPAPDGEGPHPLARILREMAGLDPTPATPRTAPSQKPLDSTSFDLT